MSSDITPRTAVHFASIQMAIERHCGSQCLACYGTGMHGQIVCGWCDGFGRRELKPKPPRYTVHGVPPMSILNSVCP